MVNGTGGVLRRARRAARAGRARARRGRRDRAHRRADPRAARSPPRPVVADGRRPPPRRLAAPRRDPAARDRRPVRHDPAVRRPADPARGVRRRAARPRRSCGGRSPRGWNLLVSGGTSSGKTTLLNALSAAIDPARADHHDRGDRRAAARAAARRPARSAARRTPKAPARCRCGTSSAPRCACGPTAIVVGEVRGAEALDLLQALNTGHDGSLSTVHANRPLDALRRLATLALLRRGRRCRSRRSPSRCAPPSTSSCRSTRGADGARRIVAIAEVLTSAGVVWDPAAVHRGGGRARAGRCREPPTRRRMRRASERDGSRDRGRGDGARRARRRSGSPSRRAARPSLDRVRRLRPRRRLPTPAVRCGTGWQPRSPGPTSISTPDDAVRLWLLAVVVAAGLGAALSPVAAIPFALGGARRRSGRAVVGSAAAATVASRRRCRARSTGCRPGLRAGSTVGESLQRARRRPRAARTDLRRLDARRSLGVGLGDALRAVGAGAAAARGAGRDGRAGARGRASGARARSRSKGSASRCGRGTSTIREAQRALGPGPGLGDRRGRRAARLPRRSRASPTPARSTSCSPPTPVGRASSSASCSKGSAALWMRALLRGELVTARACSRSAVGSCSARCRSCVAARRATARLGPASSRPGRTRPTPGAPCCPRSRAPVRRCSARPAPARTASPPASRGRHAPRAPAGPRPAPGRGQRRVHAVPGGRARRAVGPAATGDAFGVGARRDPGRELARATRSSALAAERRRSTPVTDVLARQRPARRAGRRPRSPGSRTRSGPISGGAPRLGPARCRSSSSSLSSSSCCRPSVC